MDKFLGWLPSLLAVAVVGGVLAWIWGWALLLVPLGLVALSFFDDVERDHRGQQIH